MKPTELLGWAQLQRQTPLRRYTLSTRRPTFLTDVKGANKDAEFPASKVSRLLIREMQHDAATDSIGCRTWDPDRRLSRDFNESTINS